MRNFRNYYAILGVARDAPAEEVKRAYRRLARQYHPDLNPGNKAAEEQFKVVGEAYAVLSDPERRAQYDQFGKFWKQQGFQSAPRSEAADDYGQYADFLDFVEKLLGRLGGRNGSERRVPRPYPGRPAATVDQESDGYPAAPETQGEDIEARLTLPLAKAYRGGRERVRLVNGRSLEVKLPPGMVTGQRLRFRGQGNQGGDLFLRITVAPDAVWRLEGYDLHCTVPVTPSEAVLGAQVEVPTLEGLVTLALPPGVQPGQRLRLTGRGYPQPEGGVGDLVVEIQIAIPTAVTPEERQLYSQLLQVETFDPRQERPAGPSQPVGP
ncbi:MAG: DnaJ domain-containing protein [Gloeomargaritaceae cyanobacterium C42_A2020_066]|nr:DnaJ domain-containing protein [Gloeomargaritaceae cyanobacterium C42_A2020_066]